MRQNCNLFHKKDILSNCPVIILDESTLRVNDIAKIKQAEGKGIKSQIWTMNTSWTSELQASWYCVSPSRSADVVIDILKNDLKIRTVMLYQNTC